MFKRVRHMEISLAAKCQLLFGAAVVLIIAAALWVPWRRIEQLTEQTNERTARALADWVESDHAERMEAAVSRTPTTTAPAVVATTAAATNPTTFPAGRERA